MKKSKFIMIFGFAVLFMIFLNINVSADESEYSIVNFKDDIPRDKLQYVKTVKVESDIQQFDEGWKFPQSAFSKFTNLEEIQADSDYFVSVDGVLYSRDMTELIKYPPKKLGDSYTVPDGVKTLRVEAFRDCEYLKHINLPDSLEGDLTLTFYGAKALEELDIPEGITELYYFISYNDSLKSITLPSTTEIISGMHIQGPVIFSSCHALENINVRDGGSNYKSENGILYSYNETEQQWNIYVVPPAKVIAEHEVKDDSVIFTITSNHIIHNEMRLYLAEYDDDGRLINVTCGENSPTSVFDNEIVITANLPTSSKYKYLLWGENNRPLIETLDEFAF